MKGKGARAGSQRPGRGFWGPGKSSTSSGWASVPGPTSPALPCTPALLRPPPNSLSHHLATDCALWLDIGGLNETGGPPQLLTLSPDALCLCCSPGAFILTIPPTLPLCPLPPSLPLSFFLIYLFCYWGRGISNEQDHF